MATAKKNATLTKHSLEIDPGVSATHVRMARELQQVLVGWSGTINTAEHQYLRLGLK